VLGGERESTQFLKDRYELEQLLSIGDRTCVRRGVLPVAHLAGNRIEGSQTHSKPGPHIGTRMIGEMVRSNCNVPPALITEAGQLAVEMNGSGRDSCRRRLAHQ